jgi:hypothetical protein
MADYSIINTTPSTLNIRDIYDNAVTGLTAGANANLQYSDVKMEFFRGTAYTTYLQHTTSTVPVSGWWTVTGNVANYFLVDPLGPSQSFPVIGSIIANTNENEGNCQPGWLAFHPAQNSTNDPSLRLAIKITPQNNKKITGYKLYYHDKSTLNNAVGIDSGQNGSGGQHQSDRIYPQNNANSLNFTHIGVYGGYTNVYRYTKTLSTEVTSTGYIYVHIDAGGDGLSYDAGTIRLELDVVDPYTPTPLTFVNNTLTVTNGISSTDLDLVSFQLPAGSIMYSFNVTSLLNANSITYTLGISGGAIVSTGTITTTGVNLLGGNNLTPAVDTTYILTLTSSSTNTYTIIGKMLGPGYTFSSVLDAGGMFPWNSISNSNAYIQTYVNNFVDLSGSLLIRNNGALIVGGDVSFNNINVASSAKFANDTTLKSRLFIGNDISVNGNLYVGGDLSVNGQFSGNFANNVIPTSAIINYPSSGTNLAITGNVRVAGDASFNGTTLDLSTNTILQVTGQITFNDGTIMSTYDDNILSGSFALGNAVFKDSTFAAVTCTGSVSATTKTTSSDYRIKTNVTDLDESYTVDSLVPIQYDNRLSNIHELGLIAHELQAVYPELVKGDKDGEEYQCVNYNGLIGVLVKEVQELKRRKENLCKK